MRTTEQQQYDVLVDVARRLSYKPGWKFKPYRLTDGAMGVHITWRTPSVSNQDRNVGLSHHVPISDFRTDAAVVARVYAQIEYLELHEVKEWMRFDGERVFSPHG